LSLTLGICVDRGIVNGVGDPIARYIPQFAQGVHRYHEDISIRDLLTMSSGIYWNGGVHYHCPMLEQMRRSKDWAAHIADVAAIDFPGASFVYKEWDVILLSALIGKASGGSAWDVCNAFLYEPLGIAGDRWTRSGCGADYPSYGGDATSDLSARDMAKIGLLILGGGAWEGRRIVSEGYVKAAVTPSEASKNYGYLIWLSDRGYHARGFGGQEVNVYPERNIVAAVQATVTPSSKSYGDICENIVFGGAQ
jgi:CubicO group peptidase (beta-lactamase class C family)